MRRPAGVPFDSQSGIACWGPSYPQLPSSLSIYIYKKKKKKRKKWSLSRDLPNQSPDYAPSCMIISSSGCHLAYSGSIPHRSTLQRHNQPLHPSLTAPTHCHSLSLSASVPRKLPVARCSAHLFMNYELKSHNIPTTLLQSLSRLI